MSVKEVSVMKGLVIIGAFCFLLLVFLAPVTSAGSSSNTYYVSPPGSDANDGLSWGNAFANIQHAVDVASPGDTIFVGDGTYAENVLVDKEGLTIQSENGPAVTIVQTPNPDNHVFEVTANGVSIIGFTVRNATRYPNAGIFLSGSDNCNISNNTADGNYRGIYLNSSSNNTIENNTCRKSHDYSIFINSSSNITIKNNTCENSGSRGIYLNSSSNNTIENNICENSGNGIVLNSSSNNTIKNNTCSNNGVIGISLYDYSDYNILDNNTCVNNSNGIVLYQASNNTLVNNTCVNNRFNSILLSQSPNSTLGNDTVENSQYGISLVGDSGNSILENNTIDSNSYYGISLSASNNTLRNNIFVNNGLEAGGSNLVENNTVNGKPLVYLENESNRTITNAGQVILINCDNITVRDLSISNATVGVELRGTNNSEIVNNDVSNNPNGIRLYDSDNNILKNNTIENNWDCGILLSNSSNNTIENNTIGNNSMGIDLAYSSDNNSIEYNNVLNNYKGICSYARSSDNNVVHFNNIVGNSEYGAFSEGGYVFHAENNWWGDSSGPSRAGPGTGDGVSVGIVCVPWLDAPYPEGKPVEGVEEHEGIPIPTLLALAFILIPLLSLIAAFLYYRRDQARIMKIKHMRLVGLVAVILVGAVALVLGTHYLTREGELPEQPSPAQLEVTVSRSQFENWENWEPIILTATLTSGGDPVEGKTIEWSTSPFIGIGIGSAVTDSSGRAQSAVHLGFSSYSIHGQVVFTASFAGDNQYHAAEGYATVVIHYP